MRKTIRFEYADAWLLLSVIHAYQRGKANLANIIAYGDYVNHAIFSVEELQGGIFRLIRAGYIIDKEGEYIPSSRIMQSYSTLLKSAKTVSEQLGFIRKELNSPEWSENYDPSKANITGSYKKVTRSTVEDAYNEYVNKMKNRDSCTEK